MKKSIMKKWVAALRSGEFTQIQGALENPSGNCCLGVLCNLALVEGICDYKCGLFDGESAVLPKSVQKWSGITSASAIFGANSLTHQNDSADKSFLQIANIIEKNYKKL